ncbi:MAG TPA: sigma-70 family RNA polymerase sigma factor [Chloroflexota bacterium]
MTSEQPELEIQPVDVVSDDALLAEVAAGDEQALLALYGRHVRPVYALVLRMLHDDAAAEEVVQDAFLRIWRRAGDYDPVRATFRGWLLSIAHHLSVDVLRRRRSRLSTFGRSLEARPSVLEEPRTLDVGADPVAMAENAETRATVRDALSALPSAQRSAIELAYFGGLTQNEIAETTGIPLGTIKSRIRFGMLALQGELEQRGLGVGGR